MMRSAILFGLLLSAVPLSAQTAMVHSPLGYDLPAAPGAAVPAPAPEAGVVALSDAAREATLEAAANRPAADIVGESRRQIHGEVGMMMGSHGSHALWGTAAVPLGDSGSAVVSVMTGGDNFRYRR